MTIFWEEISYQKQLLSWIYAILFIIFYQNGYIDLMNCIIENNQKKNCQPRTVFFKYSCKLQQVPYIITLLNKVIIMLDWYIINMLSHGLGCTLYLQSSHKVYHTSTVCNVHLEVVEVVFYRRIMQNCMASVRQELNFNTR